MINKDSAPIGKLGFYEYQDYEIAADFIKSTIPKNWTPEIAIICGSGMGGLASCLKGFNDGGSPLSVNYETIPFFLKSTVEGHLGKLVFGHLEGVNALVMMGRHHLYEGYNLEQTTFPIRVFSLLGVRILIVTNAAGSVNHSKFKIGDIMLIKDHINVPGLAGQNPLRGPNVDKFGPRFPTTINCYNRDLRTAALNVAKQVGLRDIVKEGVYTFVCGPSYETKAEAKLLRLLGGDAVGMSTVPETIIATHCGMEVLGISLITNLVSMEDDDQISGATHSEVLETSRLRSAQMQDFMKEISRTLKLAN
jgi:purine-nucleoside phosphorylase